MQLAVIFINHCSAYIHFVVYIILPLVNIMYYVLQYYSTISEALLECPESENSRIVVFFEV